MKSKPLLLIAIFLLSSLYLVSSGSTKAVKTASANSKKSLPFLPQGTSTLPITESKKITKSISSKSTAVSQTSLSTTWGTAPSTTPRTFTKSTDPWVIGSLDYLEDWEYRKIVEVTILDTSISDVPLKLPKITFNPPAYYGSIRVVDSEGNVYDYQLDDIEWYNSTHISAASIWIVGNFGKNTYYKFYIYYDVKKTSLPTVNTVVSYTYNPNTGEYIFTTQYYSITVKDGEFLRFALILPGGVEKELQHEWSNGQIASLFRHHVGDFHNWGDFGSQFQVIDEGVSEGYPVTGVAFVEYYCKLQYGNVIVDLRYRFFNKFIIEKVHISFSEYEDLGNVYFGVWCFDQDKVDFHDRTISNPGDYVYRYEVYINPQDQNGSPEYYNVAMDNPDPLSWPLFKKWVWDSDWTASNTESGFGYNDIWRVAALYSGWDVLPTWKADADGDGNYDGSLWLGRDDANKIHNAASVIIFPILFTYDMSDFSIRFWIEGIGDRDDTYLLGGHNLADDADGLSINFYSHLGTYIGNDAADGLSHTEWPWGSKTAGYVPSGSSCGHCAYSYTVRFEWYRGSEVKGISIYYDQGTIYYYQPDKRDLPIELPGHSAWMEYRLDVREGYVRLVRINSNEVIYSSNSPIIPFDKRYGALAIAGANGGLDMDVILGDVEIYVRPTAQTKDYETITGGWPGNWIKLHFTSGYTFGFYVLESSNGAGTQWEHDQIFVHNEGNMLTKTLSHFWTDTDDYILAGVWMPNCVGDAGYEYYLTTFSAITDGDPFAIKDQYVAATGSGYTYTVSAAEKQHIKVSLTIADGNGNALAGVYVNITASDGSYSTGWITLDSGVFEAELSRAPGTYYVYIQYPSGLKFLANATDHYWKYDSSFSVAQDYTVWEDSFTITVPIYNITLYTYINKVSTGTVTGYAIMPSGKIYVAPTSTAYDNTTWLYTYSDESGKAAIWLRATQYHVMVFADPQYFDKPYNPDGVPNPFTEKGLPHVDNISLYNDSANQNVTYIDISISGSAELHIIDLLVANAPIFVYPEVTLSYVSFLWGETISDAYKLHVYYYDEATGPEDAVATVEVKIFDKTLGKRLMLFNVTVNGTLQMDLNTTLLPAEHTYELVARVVNVTYPVSSPDQPVYPAPNEVKVTFQIDPRPTTLSVSLPGHTDSVIWGEKISIKATYEDYNLDISIKDANVILEILKGDEVVAGPFTMEMPPNSDSYYFVFDTTQLSAGSYAIRVTASKGNYTTEVESMPLWILPRPTSIRNATNFVRITWLPYYDNITFVYWDEWANTMITEAHLNVTVVRRIGTQIEPKPLAVKAAYFDPVLMRFRIEIDIEHGLGDLGYYEIWVTVSKTNYEPQYLTIILEIVPINLRIELSKYYVELVWGDTIKTHFTAIASGTNGTWYLDVMPRVDLEVINTTAKLKEVPLFYSIEPTQEGVFLISIDSGKTLPGSYRLTLTLDQTCADKLKYYTSDSKSIMIIIKKVQAILDLLIDEKTDYVKIEKLPGVTTTSSVSVVLRERGGMMLSEAVLRVTLYHGAESLLNITPSEDPYMVGVYRGAIDWTTYEPGIYTVSVEIVQFKRKDAVAPLEGYNVTDFIDVEGHMTVTVEIDYIMGSMRVAGFKVPILVVIPGAIVVAGAVSYGLYKYIAWASLPPEVRELEELIRNIEADKYEYAAPERDEIFREAIEIELGLGE